MANAQAVSSSQGRGTRVGRGGRGGRGGVRGRGGGRGQTNALKSGGDQRGGKTRGTDATESAKVGVKRSAESPSSPRRSPRKNKSSTNSANTPVTSNMRKRPRSNDAIEEKTKTKRRRIVDSESEDDDEAADEVITCDNISQIYNKYGVEAVFDKLYPSWLSSEELKLAISRITNDVTERLSINTSEILKSSPIGETCSMENGWAVDERLFGKDDRERLKQLIKMLPFHYVIHLGFQSEQQHEKGLCFCPLSRKNKEVLVKMGLSPKCTATCSFQPRELLEHMMSNGCPVQSLMGGKFWVVLKAYLLTAYRHHLGKGECFNQIFYLHRLTPLLHTNWQFTV